MANFQNIRFSETLLETLRKSLSIRFNPEQNLKYERWLDTTFNSRWNYYGPVNQFLIAENRLTDLIILYSRIYGGSGSYENISYITIIDKLGNVDSFSYSSNSSILNETNEEKLIKLLFRQVRANCDIVLKVIADVEIPENIDKAFSVYLPD